MLSMDQLSIKKQDEIQRALDRIFIPGTEEHKRFNEALEKQMEAAQPLIDQIRRSEMITGEDLAIVINARA